MSITLTPASDADYSTILELNNNACPHVNIINQVQLSSLADQSFYFSTAEEGEKIAGFIIALAPGKTYNSPNYRWFSERYDHFIYVDRIVIAPEYIGQGIGTLLYNSLQDRSKFFASIISCEVNLKPANPNSVAFHQRMGFEEVGQQETNNGENIVSLMYKELNPEKKYSED